MLRAGYPTLLREEGEVRFFQAQDQQGLPHVVRDSNRVFTHSLECSLKWLYIIFTVCFHSVTFSWFQAYEVFRNITSQSHLSRIFLSHLYLNVIFIPPNRRWLNICHWFMQITYAAHHASALVLTNQPGLKTTPPPTNHALLQEHRLYINPTSHVLLRHTQHIHKKCSEL